MKYKYIYNNRDNFKNNFLFAVVVLLSMAGFLFFLITTELILNTLLIFLLSIAIVYPYRKYLKTNNFFSLQNDKIIDLYFILFGILFVFWLLSNLGTTIVPFVLAFIMGYLLDPLVSKLEKVKIKRWVSSLCIIILFIGFLITLAIFLFPQLIEQASNITKQINQYVQNVKQFSTNKDTTAMLKKFGLSKYTLKEAFDTDLLPIIQDLSKTMFN
jgi:predicted PurR-regulated permease PerM